MSHDVHIPKSKSTSRIGLHMADVMPFIVCVVAFSLDTDDKKHTTKKKCHNNIANHNYIELVPGKYVAMYLCIVTHQLSSSKPSLVLFIFMYIMCATTSRDFNETFRKVPAGKYSYDGSDDYVGLINNRYHRNYCSINIVRGPVVFWNNFFNSTRNDRPLMQYKGKFTELFT